MLSLFIYRGNQCKCMNVALYPSGGVLECECQLKLHKKKQGMI